MTTKWVVLEEIGEEQPLCKYCKIPLEFYMNETKKPELLHKLRLIISLGMYYPGTGNGWFHCHTCKKDFLIKNYARVHEGGKDV